MRSVQQLGLCGLVLGSTLCALPTIASAEDAKVDPTGTWTWERTFGDQTVKSVLRLKLEGGKLTGTYKGRRDEPVEIANAKLEGDQLSFEYTARFDDREMKIQYRGKVSDDTIVGTSERTGGDQARTREWQARRAFEVADVLGLWKFRFTRDNGEEVETSLEVSRDGETLKGHHTSPWGEREAKSVTLKDNVFSFELSGETDNGGSFKVVSEGKLGRNSLKGVMKYRFGDNEGTRDFTGAREVKGPAAEVAVLGKWLLSVTGRDGNKRESTLEITSGGGQLKGHYTSPRGEREAKSVQFKDGELSFEISGESDRGSFRIVAKGKVSGDSIKGSVDYEFGDQKRSSEFEGHREAKPAEATAKKASL